MFPLDTSIARQHCPAKARSALLPRDFQQRKGLTKQGSNRNLTVLRAADISGAASLITPEALIAVAGTIAAGAAAWAFYSSNNQLGENSGLATTSRRMFSSGNNKRQDAVLVIGATGKMGQKVVAELLKTGRQVVAGVRAKDKADELFKDLQTEYRGLLFIEEGLDITQPSSLAQDSLWQGVSQVALCAGPVFGRQDNGEMGYKGGMTSEKVDADGVSNVTSAAQTRLSKEKGAELQKLVVPLKTQRDLSNWERIDDVIMGGKSNSSMQLSEDGQSAVWSGELVTEGGGFCGTRNKKLRLDLSQYDGIQLRVRGDGNIYKINLKTSERTDNPESTYAATFETVSGDWQTIRIPFREFVAVTRAKTDPDAPPLDTKKIGQIGLRLSRFDFNNLPNPQYKSGPFQLEFEDGISGYREERPAIIMVSSAGVERNALIGDDLEARKRDIPIVQLNPGGILNYKYKGEMAVRASGLPYCILRPVGLTMEKEEQSFQMEASQGDIISGKISRGEVARLLRAALETPASRGKTLELRRSEAESQQGKLSTDRQLEQLYLAAVQDWQRPKRNLPPLPMVTEPPPPPTKDRVNEILADPRVKEAAERSRRASAQNNGASNGSSNGASEPSNGSMDAEKPSAEASSNGDGNGAASNGSSNGSSQGKADAQQWIKDWRQQEAMKK